MIQLLLWYNWKSWCFNENNRDTKIHILYSGKVWRGESLANLANRLWFAKLKPSILVLTIDNLLADFLIRQTFFRQMLEKSQFAKLSRYTVFCKSMFYLVYSEYNFTAYCIARLTILVHTQAECKSALEKLHKLQFGWANCMQCMY